MRLTSILSGFLYVVGAECGLEVFQAATPPRKDLSDPACRSLVFEHDFGNSYGSPYAGVYSPPADCDYTTTIFNLSIASSGRQYDRLATLWLGDVEVWRTSTAMPRPSGIHWSFQKDMTIWDALLRTPDQVVIFDLGNVIDGYLYTGFFNVTLEALYFKDDFEEGLHPADHIYPISTTSSSENMASLFSLPSDDATVEITLPRNARTAVVSLMASGNGAEEFWFTNVPTEYVNTFPENDDWLYPYSPFREVQLLVDGELAGVSWPFPILFTGGVDPGAWRPIVGIDAFELPSFQIDVTPWLGILADGNPHTFALQVVSFDTAANDGIGSVGENWWVSGSVFVWVDDTIEQTVAEGFTSSAVSPSFEFEPVLGTSISEDGTATNTSFYFTLTASRSLTISSTLTSGNKTRNVSWKQNLSYSAIQNMTDLAYNQSLAMTISGDFSGSVSDVVTTFSYPINLYSAYVVEPVDPVRSPGYVFCLVDRSKILDGISTLNYLTGLSLGPESLKTRQNVSSEYRWNETIVEGTPGVDTMDGEVWFSYSGNPASQAGVAGYYRYANEKNDSVLIDDEEWAQGPVPSTIPLPQVPGEPEV